MTPGRVFRLIRQAERLQERERGGAGRRSRHARIAELRKILQAEHPDKGGDRVKFERAMLELDKIRGTRK